MTKIICYYNVIILMWCCTMAVHSANRMSHLHVRMDIIQDEDTMACEQKQRGIKQIFKDMAIFIKTCILVSKYSSAASVSSNTETQKHTHTLHVNGGQVRRSCSHTKEWERCLMSAFDFSESVLWRLMPKP